MSELSEEKKAVTMQVLVKPLSTQKTFTDSTCVKAHIHYPVDWLLLRDASRSLLSAIETIRNQAIKASNDGFSSSLMKK